MTDVQCIPQARKEVLKEAFCTRPFPTTVSRLRAASRHCAFAVASSFHSLVVKDGGAQREISGMLNNNVFGGKNLGTYMVPGSLRSAGLGQP